MHVQSKLILLGEAHKKTKWFHLHASSSYKFGLWENEQPKTKLNIE